MAQVKRSRQYDASVDDIWQRIGDFHGLHTWHPAIEDSTSQEGGEVRALALPDGGGTVVERRLREGDHTYSYRILDPGPLPVADYESTITVRAGEGGGSVIDWRADFRPEGASEDEAVAVIAGIFEGGLDAL